VCRLPCPRQCPAVGGSRYVSGHADRLWCLHPRPEPRIQRDALTAARCDEIFIDKASGKLARRPELDKALLSANRAGDQLVVTKLDRLGRSLEQLIEPSKQLQAKGVDLVVLDQSIDTSTAVGRMFSHDHGRGDRSAGDFSTTR
jgi:Resolvase, N terminal domain